MTTLIIDDTLKATEMPQPKPVRACPNSEALLLSGLETEQNNTKREENRQMALACEAGMR
jgi:hypothetical protein